MKLTYWQNKNRPSMIRVYLNNVDAFQDNRKLWCERVGKGNAWVINSNEPIDEGEKFTIRNLVISYLESNGVDRSDAVDFDMVAEAAQNPGSNRRMKTTKVENRSTDDVEIPNLLTIKVPDEVNIKIDHREPDELFSLLKDIPNVVIERAALDIGDIVLNDSIIIERKCCSMRDGGTDFENSIVNDDKRLFCQSEKLKFEEDKICIVLLEGDVYRNSKRMLIQQIDGALSFLCSIQKLSILNTYNLKHTAYMLVKLATHHRSGLGYELALRSKKPQTLIDQQRFVLEGLPAVSAEIAKRMLDQFGSLQAVFNATREELLTVEGIGKVKAEKLIMTMSARTD